MRPLLILVVATLSAGIPSQATVAAAAELPGCAVSPRLVEGLVASAGVPIHGYVTREGVHCGVLRGRAWLVGTDSLAFARDYVRVSDRPGEHGFKADSEWRVSLETVSYLLLGRDANTIDPREIGNGERVCAYVTQDGYYRSVAGMRAFQVPPGNVEFVASSDQREGVLRPPSGLYRTVVPWDSIAFVYKTASRSSTRTKAAIIATAAVVVLILCADREKKSHWGGGYDVPNIWP